MKRFDIGACENIYGCDIRIDENDDGGWVRYEDVEEERMKVARECLEILFKSDEMFKTYEQSFYSAIDSIKEKYGVDE